MPGPMPRLSEDSRPVRAAGVFLRSARRSPFLRSPDAAEPVGRAPTPTRRRAATTREETAYDRARKLEQIKDLYLTAEAIGEANVDKHFDQLLAQQRELISEYFMPPGAVRPRPEPSQPEPSQPERRGPGGDGPGTRGSRPAPRRPGNPARGRPRRRRPPPRMVTRDRQTLVIAVLGFGEAGSLIASDLAATGVSVRGFDPVVPAPPE